MKRIITKEQADQLMNFLLSSVLPSKDVQAIGVLLANLPEVEKLPEQNKTP